MAIFTLRIFTFGAVSLFVLGFLPHRVLTANSETNSSYMVNAQKLITELLKGYDRRVVPVTDGPVLVSLNLNVANFELDEYGGKFKVQGMLVKFWVDSRLDWDRKKYNIKVLCLPMKDVWRPDITLYNYVDHIDVPDMNEQAHIWKGGSVSDYNRMSFTAACEIDLKRFPFDTQTCELVFGSWLFSGDFVNLTTRFDNPYIYHERSFSKWHIESAKAKVIIKIYACCKEHYPEYVVTFVLRRLTTYSSHVLVFPAILLSALVPFLFLIPPESKERITLALCIMGINEINTVIPRYHSNVPIIVIYYVLTLVWVALSVILSIFVLNIHNRGPRRKKVPAIIRQVRLVTDTFSAV
ncbi:neuronal acetylcholine receptor subunit alpha-5-like [Octopus vulgaris]|uniref:Neuronal acetylcholine receptor subunit alpha-5-like n=1 Tax=Octopus vulgaris TaxID=6645 RepID=A0AA36FIR2_OCTVU|nr:neuronal acetylcholine receptor subunit alpha-5-like [Octopus vulgaris]